MVIVDNSFINCMETQLFYNPPGSAGQHERKPHMNLQAIRERRTAKIQEARNLTAGEMTADKVAAFDKVKAEIEGLEADEARAVFVEEAERRSAGAPVDESRRKLEGRVTLIDAINAQVEGRSLSGALAEFNQEQKRHGIAPTRGGVLVPSTLFEKRTTQDTTTNAKIVPDDYRADQFVGLFRNALVMRSLGARVLSGLRGDLVIPKQTGASSAYWLAEGDALTESSATFDNIKMTPKHVGALSSVSRQLLQQSNPSIEQLIRDDFVNVIGLAIDKAMLHGLAANDEPTGIINTTGIQTASLATLSWADVVAMAEKLALENVTPNAIVTHAKAATILQTTLKDSVAGAEYLMQAGRMAGLPVSVTNQMEAKAGTPATGRVIMGDFSQMIVADYQSAEVLANPFATGHYEKGSVQLRILATMDMAVRNPKAFVLADDLGL